MKIERKMKEMMNKKMKIIIVLIIYIHITMILVVGLYMIVFGFVAFQKEKIKLDRISLAELLIDGFE